MRLERFLELFEYPFFSFEGVCSIGSFEEAVQLAVAELEKTYSVHGGLPAEVYNIRNSNRNAYLSQLDSQGFLDAIGRASSFLRARSREYAYYLWDGPGACA